MDVRGSVHHSIIHKANSTRCKCIKIYFIFVRSSTCVARNMLSFVQKLNKFWYTVASCWIFYVNHEDWFYETTQYTISRYILVLVDKRFNIFLLDRTLLIFNWVWFKLVLQVFWSEQYDGIPEIKNRPSV